MDYLRLNIKNKIKITLLLFLSFYVSLNTARLIKAETPDTAPQKLIEVIKQIDLASNNKDLETLGEYLSPQFSHQDGFDSQNLNELLGNLWQTYPNLNYETTLQSWEQKGNQLLAKTETKITGTYKKDGREIALNSTILALQSFENGKLVGQEILKERTDLISGKNPPEVEVRLPEKVRSGEQFNFDVILQEPLGNDLVLGTAIEDRIDLERYLNPSEFELEELSAGGIFKLVTAPSTGEDLWFSAMLVKADGLRIVTQRVKMD
jgi:hypothetical protein